MEGGRQYFVYLLASRRNGTIYTGVTNSLLERVYKHKNHTYPGFTQKYNVTRLVYFEIFGDIKKAIGREKNIKAWKRAWKIKLIEQHNPTWRDLYFDVIKAAQ